MGAQIEKADRAANNEWKRAEAEAGSAGLHARLASAGREAEQPANVALQKLQFRVLFHTGADQLTARGRNRVSALTGFLRQHPNLCVHLVGHADSRGTDEYNNVLSEYRALAVQNRLETLGIKPDRIIRRAFGASQARAVAGDVEGYAKERRVDILIFDPAVNHTHIN